MFVKYIVLHTHTEFGMSTVHQFKEISIQAIDLLKLDGKFSTVRSSLISIVNSSPNVSTVNSKVPLTLIKCLLPSEIFQLYGFRMLK